MQHVSVGILLQADGKMLMAERPAGKPWEGYWEFPGGKIENGESPAAALTRELQEELGITVQKAYPWLHFEYHYPDRNVHLHFFRITNWAGELHGKEGQNISWESPSSLSVSPLLPANHKLMQTLSLPAIYAITCASKIGKSAFMTKLDAALHNGIKLIQVREPGMEPHALQKFTQNVIAKARKHNAQVLVNGNVKLARNSQADGIHLQSRQLLSCKKRPDFQLCAASCHNLEELRKAAELELDFVVLSPVLPTASHPGEPTLGWDTFASLCKEVPIPVYALGGMNNDLLNIAMEHRAHGIAMLSGIW